MTKTIKTISDLTEALVMAGHERVDGESFLYPPEGLKPSQCRWSCLTEKGMVAIAMAIPVLEEEVVPAFLLCETGDDLRTLAYLYVSEDIYSWRESVITSARWMKVSLDLILQFAGVARKTWLMSEAGIEGWIESCERRPEQAD